MYEIYRKNEAETNEMVAGIVLYLLLFVLAVGVFCWTGIFDIADSMINGFILFSAVPLILPAVLVYGLQVNRQWTKYVLIGCVALVTGIAYVVFTFQTVIVFIVPSILGAFYLDKKVMVYTGCLTGGVMIAAHLITAFYLFQPWIEPFQGLRSILLYGALPRLMQYLFCTFLLYLLCRRVSDFLSSFYRVVQENRETDVPNSMKAEQAELQKILELMTEREQEVFALLCQGKTNAQIARELCLSGGTVKNYVSVVYDKIGRKDRTALVLKYGRFYPCCDQSHSKN